MNTGPDKFSSGPVPIPDRTTSGTVLYRIPVRYYRFDYRTGYALNESGISEIFKLDKSLTSNVIKIRGDKEERRNILMFSMNFFHIFIGLGAKNFIF